MILDLDEVQREFALVNNRMPAKAYGVLLALLAFSALAIYWHALGYPFIGWDDYAFYLDDPATHALTLANLKTIFTAPRLTVWYPLARLSHAFDFALFGAHAFPSRLVNVGLHVTNAFLVFSIALACLRQSTVARGNDTAAFVGAAVAGLLFCVHPQHVEAVIWVSQRKELLSALFFFSAICLYLRYLREQSRKRYLAGTILCGILAMLAKPISVTLFPALLLFETALNMCNGKQHGLRAVMMSALRLSPLLLAGAAVSAVTLHTHDKGNSLMLDDYYALPLRIELSLYNFAHLLRCSLLPVSLAPAADIPAFVTGHGLILAVGVLVLVAALYALMRGAAYTRAFALLLFAMFIMHLPVSGLVMFGTYASGDRYAYLPTLPLYLIVGFIAARGTQRLQPETFVAVFALPLIALALLAGWQTRIWKDDFTLWRHVVDCYPRNAMSLYYLGDQYKKTGHYPEAIHSMEQSIELGPVFRGYPPFIGVADVAELYKQTGHYAQAIDAYQRVLHYYGESAPTYAAMGVLAIALHRNADADTWLDKAYSLDPAIVAELQKQLPYFSGDAQRELADWLAHHTPASH